MKWVRRKLGAPRPQKPLKPTQSLGSVGGTSTTLTVVASEKGKR